MVIDLNATKSCAKSWFQYISVTKSISAIPLSISMSTDHSASRASGWWWRPSSLPQEILWWGLVVSLLSDAELINFRCCCWSKWYGDFSVVQLKKTIPVEFLAKPNCNFIEQCSYAIWRPVILSAKKHSQPLFDCRSRYNSAYQFEQFSSWNFGFDMTVWIKAALTVVIAHELSKRLLIGAWLLKV